MRLLCFMYMLVWIASALFYVYACMLGCMYVCELGGSFAGGCPSLAVNTNTHLIQHLPSISYRIHGIGTCTFSHHLEHQEILDLSLPDDQKHRTLVVERFFDVSKMVGVSNLESAMSRC